MIWVYGNYLGATTMFKKFWAASLQRVALAADRARTRAEQRRVMAALLKSQLKVVKS